MELPVLPYAPDVDNFGSRILEMDGRRITYEEASQDPIYKKMALQINPTDVPIEFTMFVLRKMAVNEKTYRSFKKALAPEALDYFMKLLGLDPELTRPEYRERHEERPVHYGYIRYEYSSPFRGTFTKIFCKKLVFNRTNQEDTHYDKLVAKFPFKVFKDVSDRYDLEVLDALDEAFYQDIQLFLDEHFIKEKGEDDDARERCELKCNLFLNNIRHFSEIFDLSSLNLKKRLETNQVESSSMFNDYLTTFPRLNEDGIAWFKFLYEEYNNAQEIFEMNHPLSAEKYNEEYFRDLPETNFVDLYSLLNLTEFLDNRLVYTEKFKKYLFFFIHALKVDSNPIFVIDDFLFECSKSLYRYKTLKQDIEMVKDLAKISMLHLRKKPRRRTTSNCKYFKHDENGRYRIHDFTLKKIKTYILGLIKNNNPRLNVTYKTDLLVRMPFRTSDTCLYICYSKWSEIKHFRERVLCCILCPEDDPVRYIVGYNAYKGEENTFVLPENIDSLKNFVKLCSTCDVTNEPLEKPIDVFMRKFYELTETEQMLRLNRVE